MACSQLTVRLMGNSPSATSCLRIGPACGKLAHGEIYNNPVTTHIAARGKEGHMQTRKQVTVFLENKPGRLAQVLSALAHGKINIVALSVMDRHEHGVLRLVSEDEAATVKALQTLNAHFTESDVLAVELKNQPGSLAHI